MRNAKFHLSYWIIAYFAALILGLGASLFYVFAGNTELPENARLIASEYASSQVLTFNDAPHTITSVLVYDEQHNCVDRLVWGLNYIEYDAVLSPYIEELAEKDSLQSISWYRNRFEPQRTGFILVSGPRVPESSRVLFIVRKLANFDAIILFIIGCTVLYIMAAGFMYVLYRKSRETELMRQQYISNVSHELKSPIASILALTASLNDGMVTDDESRTRYYGLILNEAKNLNRTVTDMLVLSKIQCGRMDFSLRTVSAEDVIGPVAEKYATLCDDMGITFHQPVNQSGLPELITNPERVSQLLDIILDNAVKFVDEDGEIWLELTQRQRKLIVCVRDNGLGIKKEDLPHIFERFYMGDAAHNSRGSGLGLAIAMETADNLGEKLWVTSEFGKGSAFYFTLQLAQAALT